MSSINNLAIIPARSGSKRLKNKNFLDFKGRPIIHYTIEAAIESKIFDKIIISSDDPKIQEIIKSYPIDFHLRPKELASDNARVRDVINSMFNIEQVVNKDDYNYFCCLYPTAPLRNSQDIIGSYEVLIRNKANFCAAVTNYIYPFFDAYDVKDNGELERKFKDIFTLPNGQKPKVVICNGSTYWCKTSEFLKTLEFSGTKFFPYHMPRNRSVDVDTQEDFDLALYYYEKIISFL